MSIDKLKSKLNLDDEELEAIFEKVLAGGEIESMEEVDQWVNDRLLPNCMIINKEEYARMCVNALKIIPHVAATDYGTSRQRDMGQLWGDLIRGYLGEVAFLKFLKHHWNIHADLGHEKGSLKDYLPMDIHEVRFPGKPPRQPKLKISIKATKWNGIWLDIPGDQFNHSDIHLLVKVGVGRDHLFAFFKEISVFRDKVLKIGEDVGGLTRDESDKLFDSLPSFKPIPAYICGFVKKSDDYKKLAYFGRKGRKNFTITGWNGPILHGDLDKIKSKEGIDGSVKFLGIGEFSHDQGYLFNTGNLLWKKEHWDEIIKLL